MKRLVLSSCLAFVLVQFDCFGMTTAKHVKVDWNEDELRTYKECRDFYVRAINNEFEGNESLRDIDDYVELLQFYADELQYENPSLNDRLKRATFETQIALLKALR